MATSVTEDRTYCSMMREAAYKSLGMRRFGGGCDHKHELENPVAVHEASDTNYRGNILTIFDPHFLILLVESKKKSAQY